VVEFPAVESPEEAFREEAFREEAFREAGLVACPVVEFQEAVREVVGWS
jgi:hypothetical protein